MSAEADDQSQSTDEGISTTVFRVKGNGDTTLSPWETKVLSIDASVRGTGSEMVLFITSDSSDTSQSPFHAKTKALLLTDNSTWHTIDVQVVNTGNATVSMPPPTLQLFALPLSSCSINPIHIFESSSSGGSQNAEPRPTRHEIVRNTVTRTGTFWTVKTSVRRIRWAKVRNPNVQLGHTYQCELVINVSQPALESTDALTLTMCSDRWCRVLKAEVRDPPSNAATITMEHISAAGPPRDLVLQFSIFAHRAQIVMARNPEPYMSIKPHNGLLVRSPRTLRLSRGSRQTLLIKNGYEAFHEWVGVFVPRDMTGVNMSCLVWTAHTPLSLTVTATERCTIDENQVIGDVFFFPEESLSIDGASRPEASQLHFTTSIRGEEPESYDSDDSDTSESSDDLEMPSVLKTAMKDYKQCRRASSSSEDDADTVIVGNRTDAEKMDEERTEEGIDIVWQDWTASTPLAFCAPFSVNVRAGVERSRTSTWMRVLDAVATRASWSAANAPADPRAPRPTQRPTIRL